MSQRPAIPPPPPQPRDTERCPPPPQPTEPDPVIPPEAVRALLDSWGTAEIYRPRGTR